MVTAARDVATVQAAMRHGALQYLVKPFNFAGLRGKLEAYATLRRTLEGGGEAEQAEVDRIFGVLAAGSVAPDLPKGTPHHGRTGPAGAARRRRAAVRAGDRRAVRRQPPDRPALPQAPGTDRPGAPLARYGETGRPEHRYAWASSPPTA